MNHSTRPTASQPLHSDSTNTVTQRPSDPRGSQHSATSPISSSRNIDSARTSADGAAANTLTGQNVLHAPTTSRATHAGPSCKPDCSSRRTAGSGRQQSFLEVSVVKVALLGHFRSSVRSRSRHSKLNTLNISRYRVSHNIGSWDSGRIPE